MRFLAIAALAATLPVAAIGGASAQSTGTMNGVVHTGAKARCSPGDPNVMVNTKTKTFMLDKSVKASTMKPGAMANDAAAGAAASGMSTTKSNMASMCKSEALSMGAKMMPAGKGMSKGGM